MTDGLLQDVRQALRGWRRNPGFLAVALATMAAGIGASTAIFSAVDAVLLRPLPYPDPDRLVAIHSTRPQRGVTGGTPSTSKNSGETRADTTYSGSAPPMMAPDER